MLDHQDGDAELADLDDQLAELSRLLRIEAGRRLVEKQQLRLGCERAREFHAPLQAVGKTSCRGLCELAKTKRVEDRECTRVRCRLLPARERHRQERRPEAVLHAAVLTEQDVFEHRQTREEPQILERSADAKAADAVTFQRRRCHCREKRCGPSLA